MFDVISSLNTSRRFSRTLYLAILVISMALLAGCISSSRVYNNDKNVVYNGAMYNLANVKQINTSISGKLSDSNTVDLKGADRKQIEAYLKEYDSIYVRMAFQFDDQEMLYRASSVDSWSAYNKMRKSLESAGNQISKLMADKKKIQLKLK
jgi:hypothetical protein